MLSDSQDSDTSRSQTPNPFYDTIFKPGSHRTSLNVHSQKQAVDSIVGINKTSLPNHTAEQYASDDENAIVSDLEETVDETEEDLVFRTDSVWQNGADCRHNDTLNHSGPTIQSCSGISHPISESLSFQEVFNAVSEEVERGLLSQHQNLVVPRSSLTNFRDESHPISESSLNFNQYLPIIIPSFPQNVISTGILDNILETIPKPDHETVSVIMNSFTLSPETEALLKSISTETVRDLQVVDESTHELEKNYVHDSNLHASQETLVESKEKKKTKKKKKKKSKKKTTVKNESLEIESDNNDIENSSPNLKEDTETGNLEQSVSQDEAFNGPLHTVIQMHMNTFELELRLHPIIVPTLFSQLVTSFGFEIQSVKMLSHPHSHPTPHTPILFSLIVHIPQSCGISSLAFRLNLERLVKDTLLQVSDKDLSNICRIHNIRANQLDDSLHPLSDETGQINKKLDEVEIQTVLSHTLLPEIGLVAFSLDHHVAHEVFMLNLDVDKVFVASCIFTTSLDPYQKRLFSPWPVASEKWIEWQNMHNSSGWLILAFSGYNCLTELRETVDVVRDEVKNSFSAVLVPSCPEKQVLAAFEFFESSPFFESLLSPVIIQKSVALIHPKAVPYLGDILRFVAGEHVLITAVRMIRLSNDLIRQMSGTKHSPTLAGMQRERVLAMCLSSEYLPEKLAKIFYRLLPASLKDLIYFSRIEGSKEVELYFTNTKSPFSSHVSFDNRDLLPVLSFSQSRLINTITLMEETPATTRNHDVQMNECDLLIAQKGDKPLRWMQTLSEMFNAIFQIDSEEEEKSSKFTLERASMMIFSKNGIQSLRNWNRFTITTQIEDQITERPCLLIRLTGQGVTKQVQSIVRKCRRAYTETVIVTSTDASWVRPLLNGTYGQ